MTALWLLGKIVLVLALGAVLVAVIGCGFCLMTAECDDADGDV